MILNIWRVVLFFSIDFVTYLVIIDLGGVDFMEQLLKLLEIKYTPNELQKFATVLNKKYRFSFFFDGWSVLNEVLFIPADISISEYRESYHYKDFFNEFVLRYGKNESIIKYFLTKEFIGNKNEVCMFEFPVLNSRADFVRINGVSHAYEIKTEIDTLNRLRPQLIDYMSAFEYVTVVIHPTHLKKVKSMIPKRVGIMTYVQEDNTIKFNTVREASLIKTYKKGVQLNVLNSSDLKYIIKSTLDCDVPEYKDERYKLVRAKHNKESLNTAFKETMKKNKQKKWEHIKENFDMLKPIEIQAAFSDGYLLR